jgi:thioredoxin 1
MNLSAVLRRITGGRMIHERKHLAFLRDVFDVTRRVWGLGASYDKLYRGRRQLANPSVSWPAPRDVTATGDQTPQFLTPSQLRADLVRRIRTPNAAAHIAIADIDHLDLFNEVGRQVGDEAIGRVAHAFRETGTVALTHAAGDSFVALISSSPEEWALRVKRNLADEGIRVVGGGTSVWVPLRVSLGVASAPADGATADALFGSALTRLRGSKVKRRGESREIERALRLANDALQRESSVPTGLVPRGTKPARRSNDSDALANARDSRPSTTRSRPLITTTSAKVFNRKVLLLVRPVVVDFWAAWCKPCRRLEAALEDLAKKYSGVVDFARIDVDIDPDIGDSCGVTALPTIALFQKGADPFLLVGPRTSEQIERLLGLRAFRDEEPIRRRRT